MIQVYYTMEFSLELLLRHVARVTQTKLNNLGIEVLPHPPYSPDLSPGDSFFKHLDNFTRNRQFQNQAAVEEAFKEFTETI